MWIFQKKGRLMQLAACDGVQRECRLRKDEHQSDGEADERNLQPFCTDTAVTPR